MIVGERLKALRESKDLNQGDIEQKTGLARTYLSRCENGHTVPNIETLERWARALDITLSQLFADDGEPAPILPALKPQPMPKLSRSAAKHLRTVEKAFARMQPREIALVALMARKFAAEARLAAR
jgi:transcriptional regulator with XRE-family HTH domain